MESYENLKEKIATAAGIPAEEVEQKVIAKRKKLSGLISKEGAAQIVAAELGISFEGEKVKISELKNGNRRANTIGKITRMNTIREFNKNGRSGKVASFHLGDETSNIRIAMWDDNHIQLIEKGKIAEGDTVEITAGSVRNGELHVTSFSDIKKSKETLKDVKETVSLNAEKSDFSKIKEGDRKKVRAVIVQSFEPRIFESKQKPGQKGVLLNLVLDDGTETMRAVMFNETIQKLIEIKDEELHNPEKIVEKKQELLGEEKIFTGNFRKNNFTNNIEMTVSNVENYQVQELIAELQKTNN